MIDSIKTMLESGVSIELLYNVALSAVALLIVLRVKDFVSNLAAWLKFQNSPIVGYNSKIQVGTANGSKQGVVLPSSSRKRVAVDFGETVRYITPKTFMSSDIEIVKPKL